MIEVHHHPENNDVTIEGEKIKVGTILEKNDFYASSDGTWRKFGLYVGLPLKSNNLLLWVRPTAEWLQNNISRNIKEKALPHP